MIWALEEAGPFERQKVGEGHPGSEKCEPSWRWPEGRNDHQTREEAEGERRTLRMSGCWLWGCGTGDGAGKRPDQTGRGRCAWVFFRRQRKHPELLGMVGTR